MKQFRSAVGSDPAVHALQFLDVINMKDPGQKTNFFRNTLPEVLPYIPRVSNVAKVFYITISLYSRGGR